MSLGREVVTPHSLMGSRPPFCCRESSSRCTISRESPSVARRTCPESAAMGHPQPRRDLRRGSGLAVLAGPGPVHPADGRANHRGDHARPSGRPGTHRPAVRRELARGADAVPDPDGGAFPRFRDGVHHRDAHGSPGDGDLCKVIRCTPSCPSRFYSGSRPSSRSSWRKR